MSRTVDFVSIRLETDELPLVHGGGHWLRVKVNVDGLEFGELRYLPPDHIDGLLDRLLDSAVKELKRHVRERLRADEPLVVARLETPPQ